MADLQVVREVIYDDDTGGRTPATFKPGLVDIGYDYSPIGTRFENREGSQIRRNMRNSGKGDIYDREGTYTRRNVNYVQKGDMYDRAGGVKINAKNSAAFYAEFNRVKFIDEDFENVHHNNTSQYEDRTLVKKDFNINRSIQMIGLGNRLPEGARSKVDQIYFDHGNKFKKFNDEFEDGGPGPHEYYIQYDELGSEKDGYTFFKQKDQGYENGVPGPSEYEIREEVTKIRTKGGIYGDGQSERFTNGGLGYPGPGRYGNPNDHKFWRDNAPKHQFGNQERMGKWQIAPEVNPGPGTYVYPTEIEEGVDKQKGTTIVPKRNKKNDKTQDFPAPNAYKVKEAYKHLPYGKIAKAKREAFKIPWADTPSPQVYNVRVEQVKNSVPKYTMGTSKRTKIKQSFDDNPASNTYKVINQPGKDVPSFSIPRAEAPRNDNMLNNFVSPSSYEPGFSQVKERTPGGKFGKEPNCMGKDEDQLFKLNTPSGADYRPDFDTVRPNATKKSFPKAERTDKKPSNYPAPDAYSHVPEIDRGVKDKKGATMSSRYKKLDKVNENPGPDHYAPQFNFTKPKFPHTKFPKAERNEKKGNDLTKEKRPGPAEYDPVNIKAHRRPAWGFGKTKRLMDDGEADDELFFGASGPPLLDLRRDLGDTGGKWVMGIKPFKHIKLSDVPGPGSYQPQKADEASILKPKMPRFTFGKEKQRPEDKKEVDIDVGPADYNPNTDPIKEAAPGVKFGKEDRGRSTAASEGQPGPADYNNTSIFDEGVRDNKGMSLSSRHGIQKHSFLSNPGPDSYFKKDETSSLKNSKLSMK